MNNVNNRLRRARKTRAKIAELKVTRLSVHRTNTHIYAQIIAETGDRVIASASTVEADVRKKIKNGGNVEAAAAIGKLIAEKAKKQGLLLSLLTVQVTNITAVLKRWLMPHAKTACPSNWSLLAR